MSAEYHKNFDISKVRISPPEKQDKTYKSKISVEGKDKFLLQTPELNFENGSITFKMTDKGRFFTLIEDIQNKIIQILHSNSEKFFKGKQFSESRIIEAMSKIVSLENEGIVRFNNVVLSEPKVYNRFKDLISLPNEPFVGSCILSFDTLSFKVKGMDIIINLSISYIKVARLLKKKSKESEVVCILEDSEDETIVENFFDE